MHIPDGYLSPSTCASLYAGAAPFWYVALRRVKKQLHSRTIPLLAMFAAFSFVIMMFNLPLPGGTTGHAVGMGMAAIVLGPWISMLAISIALSIQALFFGDGGITTYGANCFNMAIAGSLVTYGVYRALSYGADITSRRRIFAAGLAGYAAINVAAFLAAVEFGIQPLLFRNAAGAPLYAPYPLSISIPAMMVGHLTFAGLAEMLLAAGIVGYLQRAEPEILRGTSAKPPLRWLWVALAAALVLTPLGILAGGSAWGEWRKPSVWKAPFADYAPRFIGNAWFGYFVAALIGVALVLLFSLSMRIFVRRQSFLERTVRTLTNAVEQAILAEHSAQSRGWLQALDPRVKLAAAGALLLATISVHRLWVLLALFAPLALIAAVLGARLATRSWMAVLAFTGVIAIPAVFLVRGGITSAALLISRAEIAATISVLLIVSTPWNRLLRAIRWFRLPVVAVVLLEASYRFAFLLLETARDMFEARSTRLIGELDAADQRRCAAASAGVLLDKTLLFSGEVHIAMQARGFRGEPMLLEDLRMRRRDWAQLSACLVLACAAAWLGR